MPRANPKEGEFDLNDQLQSMQDVSCFNMFKKRHKKGKKYHEWKKDMLRNDDSKQMNFLLQQVQRLRKKEDLVVTKKAVPKK